jgi:hypothetical protein
MIIPGECDSQWHVPQQLLNISLQPKTDHITEITVCSSKNIGINLYIHTDIWYIGVEWITKIQNMQYKINFHFKL